MLKVSCSRCAEPPLNPIRSQSNGQALAALDSGGDRQGREPRTLRMEHGTTFGLSPMLSVASCSAFCRPNVSSKPLFARTGADRGRILRLHRPYRRSPHVSNDLVKPQTSLSLRTGSPFPTYPAQPRFFHKLKHAKREAKHRLVFS